MRVGPIIVLAALSCSCALTSRSEPLPIRYFSADATTRRTAPALSAKTDLTLRLDRVRSSSHLGEPIAFRTSEHEVGYYDEVRWTEQPEAFLERGLERALFQERGVTRVIGGASETLSVELIAFEEVRGPQPVARLVATLTLHDERAAQLEQTIRVERPIPSTGGDAASRAVTALSGALDEAVEQIAQAVAQRLQVLADNDQRMRGQEQPAEAAAVR